MSNRSNGSDRSKRPRRHSSAEEKVAILRLHLLEGMPVSDVYEQHGVNPTLFCRWQKDFFEKGAAAFARSNGQRDESHKDRRIEALQAKLAAKNEVIAESMEENVKAKKRDWAAAGGLLLMRSPLLDRCIGRKAFRTMRPCRL